MKVKILESNWNGTIHESNRFVSPTLRVWKARLSSVQGFITWRHSLTGFMFLKSFGNLNFCVRRLFLHPSIELKGLQNFFSVQQKREQSCRVSRIGCWESEIHWNFAETNEKYNDSSNDILTVLIMVMVFRNFVWLQIQQGGRLSPSNFAPSQIGSDAFLKDENVFSREKNILFSSYSLISQTFKAFCFLIAN